MEGTHRRNQIESLTVELTGECNNNCFFCYQKKEQGSKINLNDIKREITEFKKAGGKYIEFSGGEPTMSSHLPELIGLAKRAGYQNISLLTNGRRLAYANYFNNLIKAGLKTVIFSIPGHTHDLYGKITRTNRASFHQLKNALEIAERNRNKLEIGTVTVINNYNYRYLPQIVDWLAGRKFSFISLVYPVPFEEENNSKIFPTTAKAYPYVKKALASYKGKAKIFVDCVPYCQLPGYERFVLNEIFQKDSLVVGPRNKIWSRLETVKMLSTRTTDCDGCAYKERCPGIFISYKDKYNVGGRKKIQKKQKIALDIQSGSCDYDYIFCTRQIDGLRYHELKKDRAIVDYKKLESFFRTSHKISRHLDIWGRERADEHPDIFRILKIAKKYFPDITLWSSGLNLNEKKRIRLFMKNGVTKFEIPLYGASEKTHDEITRRKGSFKKIISALNSMEKAKAQISLHVVSLKQNYWELPQVIKLASEYKKAALAIWFYYPDPAVDHRGINVYQKHCPAYSQILNCLSGKAEEIKNLPVKFVFFPRCIFLAIRGIMKKAELVETGFVRLMITDSQQTKYEFLTGQGEFGTIFPKKCNSCFSKKDCAGIFKDYLKIYGDSEIKPIKH